MVDPGELRVVRNDRALQNELEVFDGYRWHNIGRPAPGSTVVIAVLDEPPDFTAWGSNMAEVMPVAEYRQITVTIPQYRRDEEPGRAVAYPRAELRPNYVALDVCHCAFCLNNGAADLAERERRRAAAEQRQRQAEQAAQRATELLLRLLDDDQRRQYRQNQTFELTGSAGTRFRVRYGISGNVDVLQPDGSFGGTLCGYPAIQVRQGDALPTPDVLVGQLLVLRGDEPHFWREANIYCSHRYAEQRRREVLGEPPARQDSARIPVGGNLFTNAVIEHNYIAAPVTAGQITAGQLNTYQVWMTGIE
jgi:hypothetical protein